MGCASAGIEGWVGGGDLGRDGRGGRWKGQTGNSNNWIIREMGGGGNAPAW